MLVKRDSQNRITLPKSIMDEMPEASYYEVCTDGASIILTPVANAGIPAVYQKLAELQITELDVMDAISWARRQS